MKASEIRSELLEQHAGLRSLLEEACRSMEGWRDGEGTRGAARDCLLRLADAARRHNVREELLLRNVIPTVDPWGPVRAEIMDEEHVKEHQDLYAALRDAAGSDDAKVAAGRIAELRTRMLEHMAREERGFLGEDALRDDDVSIDSFTG